MTHRQGNKRIAVAATLNNYLKQQQTNTLPLDTFISYYKSWNGEMKGVIHFTKEQTLPLVYV